MKSNLRLIFFLFNLCFPLSLFSQDMFDESLATIEKFNNVFVDEVGTFLEDPHNHTNSLRVFEKMKEFNEIYKDLQSKKYEVLSKWDNYKTRKYYDSIDRTRKYILSSFLAWAVDCLDSYMSMCNQGPKLIDNEDLTKAFEKANRSVNEKFIAIARHVDSYDNFDIYASIVGLAIQWRNNTTHSSGDNKIDEKVKEELDAKQARLEEPPMIL